MSSQRGVSAALGEATGVGRQEFSGGRSSSEALGIEDSVSGRACAVRRRVLVAQLRHLEHRARLSSGAAASDAAARAVRVASWLERDELEADVPAG